MPVPICLPVLICQGRCQHQLLAISEIDASCLAAVHTCRLYPAKIAGLRPWAIVLTGPRERSSQDDREWPIPPRL